MAIVNYALEGIHREIRCPVSDLSSFVTPEDQLFILAHLGIPIVDRDAWRLAIGGLSARSIELSFDDISSMPGTELTAFHKCAGNPLEPRIPTPDRVGNVVWRGVRLRDLLELVQPAAASRFVWASGVDGGEFDGVAVTAYCKDLPWEKANSPEVLVAYAMNGEPLTPERGGPVRLIVPGWYGTNSVKWLTELKITDRRSPGLFTVKYYNDPALRSDERLSGTIPVWGVQPDSVIISPRVGEPIASGPLTRIRGWAWGEHEIIEVVVSLDNGTTWHPTKLASRVGFSWQAFEAEMPRLEPGSHSVLSRATDAKGQVQPVSAGFRNAAVPIHFSVVAPNQAAPY